MYIEKLYEKYCREYSAHLQGDTLTFGEFQKKFGARLEAMERAELHDPAGEGILCYAVYAEGPRQVCVIPAYGCYASSPKVLTRLFSELSAKLVSGQSTDFQVHLYAHDLEAQRVFSMMQFGYMAETGLCGVSLPAESPFSIRTLDRDEIEERWDEVWSMTASILAHLRKAPIFYPCQEFTEDVYRDFFTDEETRLHVAFDEKGRMIGMIETNGEPNPMVRNDTPSVNVGEIYVLPEYRRTGLSDALLSYAMAYEEERGAGYLWVEHGTANPNAGAFWGRYFETCEYELDRSIEHL